MKNQNSKFKHVLQEYDVESVEIHNYDLFAKLKDKIKKEKSNNIAKDKESKMARKSKTDTILEVVLNLKEDFNDLKTRVGNLENNFNEFKTEVKNDLNNFKIEVREEFSKVNSRLDKLEDDVHILKDDVSNLKQDVNSLKSEAIKHGWNIN